MSGHVQHAGRIGGSSLILFSVIGEWLIRHGLSEAMVWIALLGLMFNLFTGIPAAEKSVRVLRDWWASFRRKNGR